MGENNGDKKWKQMRRCKNCGRLYDMSEKTCRGIKCKANLMLQGEIVWVDEETGEVLEKRTNTVSGGAGEDNSENMQKESSGTDKADDIIKPDGTVIKANGDIINPNGDTVKPDGTVIRANGDTVKPNGDTVKPDGTIVKPNGEEKKPNGDIVKPNGDIVKPDGTIIETDGDVVKPNGDRIKPDGTIIKLDGTVVISDKKDPSKKKKKWPKWIGIGAVFVALAGAGAVYLADQKEDDKPTERMEETEKDKDKTKPVTKTSGTEADETQSQQQTSDIAEGNGESGDIEIWTSDSGNWCRGTKKNGVMDGYGICIYSNGDIYEGEWTEGVKNGEGMEYYAESQSWCIGTWVDGERTTAEYMWSDGEYYAGEFAAYADDQNKRGGEGVQVYEGGDIYMGEWKEDKRSGDGTYIWTETGAIFDGEWDDVRNGEGELCSIDRMVQKGVWEEDELVELMDTVPADEGQETWTNENGISFTGVKTNGELNGEGSAVYEPGEWYHGEFINGVRNGIGVYGWAEGGSYYGEWENGDMEGSGIRFYVEDGEETGWYMGEVSDGYREGEGLHYFSDNQSWYKGTWNEGDQEGEGTAWWPSGAHYEGEYSDGLQNGYGICQWPDGDRYEGQWVEGERTGEGIMYRADGTVESGIWENGELVD